MMKKFIERKKELIVTAFAFVLIGSAFFVALYCSDFVFAWVGPTAHPFENNVSFEDACYSAFGEVCPGGYICVE